MRCHLLFIILIAFGIQSCNSGVSATWKDKNIDPKLRDQIQELDNQIFKAITSNDPQLMRSMMSDQLMKVSGNEIEQVLKVLGEILGTDPYKNLNQFYTQNSTLNIASTVSPNERDSNEYRIQTVALNKEMFLSVYETENKTDNFFILNVYGKYPEGWKLNILHFGQYTMNHLTAPQLYAKAQEAYHKEYLSDAANYMFLVFGVINEANKYIKYPKEKEMKNFQEKLMKEIYAQYSFPFVLKEIITHPEIFRVYPQGMDHGYFPMVEYRTSIDLKDIVQLQEENQSIQHIIGKTFKGIDKEK